MKECGQKVRVQMAMGPAAVGMTVSEVAVEPGRKEGIKWATKKKGSEKSGTFAKVAWIM
jgi:hypothetical protein